MNDEGACDCVWDFLYAMENYICRGSRGISSFRG